MNPNGHVRPTPTGSGNKINALSTLRIKVNCHTCVQKCCSQPYDWVYLTSREIAQLQAKSGLPEAEFVVKRQNAKTGHIFRALDLPCRFFDPATGRCSVYEARPLVCRLFPFYPEPLTGDATLLPIQCGDNLHFMDSDAREGWRLLDFEQDVRTWLTELWDEAINHPAAGSATSTARAAGSP